MAFPGKQSYFLDACFIIWIFSSLSKTMDKLQMRRNLAKLELYCKFTNTLAVSVFLSIAWIGFELYFKATDPLSELWQIAWIIPAFWNMLAYSLLVVICVLWAPSHNPTRYAYMEEMSEESDEEGIALTGNNRDMAMKLERQAIGEDLEEDKRE